MAKVHNEEAKEEGEISDEDDINERSVKSQDDSSRPVSTMLNYDSQKFSAAPTQFIGRSNRPKQKTGSAKFLKGSKNLNEARNKHGNRLPSPKHVLPSLMQLKVHPSKELLQGLPKENHLFKPQSAVNHVPKPESHGGSERIKLPTKSSFNTELPKKSPGARCILSIMEVAGHLELYV